MRRLRRMTELVRPAPTRPRPPTRTKWSGDQTRHRYRLESPEDTIPVRSDQAMTHFEKIIEAAGMNLTEVEIV